MKILIVGGGGREHALAWKMAQSSDVDIVYVAPGNAGTATENKIENIAIDAEDIPALLDFAQEQSIELSVIGPEVPLVAGIVDAFNHAGLACYGPSQQAAILEGSKSFSKDFLKRHDIPSAAYEVFTDIAAAKTYIEQQALPIVIKADGLAAGKGVIIAQTQTEAFAAVDDMLAGNKFGEAGHRIVVEEFLQGEEVSFIVMCDGEHYLPLASSQDHKARDDGDQGPNTGGMGAYSPAPIINPTLHENILKRVIEPTLNGMKAEGREYCGFLYAGLMITEQGTPKVLEFNCRFGDPETQPIIMRLKSDLALLCLAAVEKKLDQVSVEWDEQAALTVVLASAGYPANPRKGDAINGLESNNNSECKVFHAGTKEDQGKILTAGGRVLCVTALANTVKHAQRLAYKRIESIQWDGMFYRNDIGYRAINRQEQD